MTAMTRHLIAALVLLLTGAACHADIYLVTRNKIEGTDYVSVNFLHDPQRMNSREVCEMERKSAQTTGFQIFAGAFVMTRRGMSATMRYSCLESKQQFSRLGPARGRGFTYLVEVSGRRFSVTPYDTLGQCRAVAGRGNQASETRYCAQSTQRLLRKR